MVRFLHSRHEMVELSCKLERSYTRSRSREVVEVKTSKYTQSAELGGRLVMDEGEGRQNVTPSSTSPISELIENTQEDMIMERIMNTV